MATTVLQPLRGKRLRITTLDSCGKYPDSAAAGSALVTSGFISISLGIETEDGDEIIQKRADGELCINEKFSDAIKRATLELELCEVNPNLLSLITSAEPYPGSGSDVIGYTVPSGPVEKWFALELWTGIAGGGCDSNGETWGYVLLPFVAAGILGDIVINGTDAVTFTMTGAYTKDGNTWGKGPWDVIDDSSTDSPLPTALDTDDHILMISVDVAPPDASDDLIAMPTTGQ